MTEFEERCISQIRWVPHLWGSTRAFIDHMVELSTTRPDEPITTRQSANLVRLVWRYRRSVRDKGLVAECGIMTCCGRAPLPLPHYEP